MTKTYLEPPYKERLETVRDNIAENKQQFNYEVFFSENEAELFITTDPQELTDSKNCGTAACVAGWTFYLYPEECIRSLEGGIDCRAGDVLGLDANIAYFLFNMHASVATANDAIRRINWLLDGNDYADYDFFQEEWFQ